MRCRHWILTLALIGLALLSNANRIWLSAVVNWVQVLGMRQTTYSTALAGLECTRRLALPLWLHDALLTRNEQTQFVRANLAWLTGDCELALEGWQVLSAEGGARSDIASLFFLQALLNLGRRDEAVEVAAKAGLAPYFHHVAYSQEIAGQTERAVEFYELAIAADPQYASLMRLGDSLGQQGNDQARAFWRQVLSSGRIDGLLALVAAAELARLEEQWDTAIIAYRTAIAEAGGNQMVRFDLHLRLGRLLRARQDFDSAIAEYEQAIRVRVAGSSEPYTAIAAMLARMGEIAEAEAWLAKAFPLFPNDPWPFIHAGDIRRQLNDVAGARQYYHEALKALPEHFGARWSLGTLEHAQGDVRAAMRILEQANDPFNCQVAGLLVQLYQEAELSHAAQSMAQRVATECVR